MGYNISISQSGDDVRQDNSLIMVASSNTIEIELLYGIIQSFKKHGYNVEIRQDRTLDVFSSSSPLLEVIEEPIRAVSSKEQREPLRRTKSMQYDIYRKHQEQTQTLKDIDKS